MLLMESSLKRPLCKEGIETPGTPARGTAILTARLSELASPSLKAVLTMFWHAFRFSCPTVQQPGHRRSTFLGAALSSDRMTLLTKASKGIRLHAQGKGPRPELESEPRDTAGHRHHDGDKAITRDQIR